MFSNKLLTAFSLTLAFQLLPAHADLAAATSTGELRAQKSIGDPVFNPATLTGTTIWTAEIQPGFIPARGSVLDFDTGGTGTSYERINTTFGTEDLANVPETFSWTINAGVLDITFDDFTQSSFPALFYPYDELAEIYGFDQSVVDFMNTAFENGEYQDGVQVEMVETTVGRSVSIDSVGVRRLNVTVDESTEYSFDAVLVQLNWPGPLPRGVLPSTTVEEVYLNSEITNVLATPPAAGDEWAVPFLFRPMDPLVVEVTEQGLFTDSLTLDALGSTSTGALSAKAFAWSNTAEGLVLESGNNQYSYVPIEFDGSVYFTLVTYRVEGDVQLRNAQWIARSDGTGPTLAADLAQPIPFYWQAGINSSLAFVYEDSGLLQPMWVFGYSFADVGTSFRIFGPFGNVCVPDDGQTCFIAEGEPLWTWTASDDFIVRERMQPGFNRERSWKVMNYQPGGLATVLEWEVREFTDSPWNFLINPRINTLEILSLSSWPEEWADSDGFYPDVDDDGDGIANAADNCLQVATTDLRDGDADGIGTACDTDHNQDCIVNFLDLAMFAENFLGDDDNYDYSGDGLINFVDLVQIRDSFFTNFSSGPNVSGVPNICN